MMLGSRPANSADIAAETAARTTPKANSSKFFLLMRLRIDLRTPLIHNHETVVHES
jgi:hypothetical protein